MSEDDKYTRARVLLQAARADQPDFCWRPDSAWLHVCIREFGHVGRCGWDTEAPALDEILAVDAVVVRTGGPREYSEYMDTAMSYALTARTQDSYHSPEAAGSALISIAFSLIELASKPE